VSVSPERASKITSVGVVVLAGLAAAQPFLTSGGRLPWAADTLIHLYRLVELDHLLRHGYLFSRWSPDLAYGYGFPLFNFYAPLSYYLAEFFRLIGLDFAPTLLTAFVVFILAAGLAMYGWAADVWGRRAGLVAAAAYVTAPYLLYNIYHRSALAEVLAMALMPAIFWAMTRLVRGDTRFFVPFVLLYAALILSHNITFLIFTPVMVVYAGVLLMKYGTRATAHVLRIALAILLGLGLAAFFWIPMVLEQKLVQVIQLFLPEAFDYHFNFVALTEIFSLPVAADPNLVLPPTPRSLGLIPLVLALLTFVLGWRRWGREQQSAAIFAAALMLFSLFLMLPQSTPIWDALPILRFVQFPWRLLGPASLAVAFLAGGVFMDGGTFSRYSSFVVLTIAALIVYGFTWQYVPYLAPIVRPTVADITRYERESGALGTTSAGDYLPNTVKKLPETNAPVERLDAASLPPGAKVLVSEYRPLSADVTIDSPAPFVAVFKIFDFAGWRASVDDQPVGIAPTEPHGLISFPVPAGQHRVRVWFGSTSLRTAAGIMSLLSLMALIGVMVVHPSLVDLQPTVLRPAAGNLRLAIWTCITILVITAVKSCYLDGRETIFRHTRFDGTRIAGVAHPLNVNWDNQLVLMGFEPARLSAEMGGSVRVALYWRAATRLEADYSVSAKLVDERGFVYGQRDSQHPGGYPTSRWERTNYARDVHDIVLAPGTPPGEYRLRIGVYRVGAPAGLSVLDANGAPAGTTVDVARVSVERSGWPGFRPAAPKFDHSSGALLAPGLVLLGYDLPLMRVSAGDKLPFTLYWQASQAQSRDLQARLRLIDANGTAVFSADFAPIGQFSTGRLRAGDVLRGPNAVRLPASISDGIFALHLSLVDDAGVTQGETVELGRVAVRAPERTMTSPHAAYPTQADLGDQVRLIGYDLSAVRLVPGGTLTVTLHWQALREMAGDYKAFVHLLDFAGRMVIGSDAIPANWTRPTTGWIGGEYVTDLHTLALPPDLAAGEYRLEVGLYDTESGLRLGDRILLGQPIIVMPVP